MNYIKIDRNYHILLEVVRFSYLINYDTVSIGYLFNSLVDNTFGFDLIKMQTSMLSINKSNNTVQFDIIENLLLRIKGLDNRSRVCQPWKKN